MSGSALELTRPSSDETERKKVSAIFNFMEVPVGPIGQFFSLGSHICYDSYLPPSLLYGMGRLLSEARLGMY